MSIESQVRDELHRTNDIAQMPPGTIDEVLRAARTRRNRRRAGTVLGVAALAAALVVPTVALRKSSESAAAPHRGSLLIGAYAVFSGKTSYTERVLDPATGKYVAEPKVEGVRAQDVQFSPDGRNVIFRPNTSEFHFRVESTADFAAGRVKNATSITPAVLPDRSSAMLGEAQWSADGKRIVVPYYKYKGKQRAGFYIYDVAAHKLGRLVTLPNVDVHVAWGRSSTEIVGSQDALGVTPAGTIRFYSLTGKLREQVSVSAGKDAETEVAKLGPFSPTGRYFTLSSGRVYDLRDHTVLRDPKLPQCSTRTLPNPIGWYSDKSYLLACSKVPAVYVVNVNGRVERTIKLPYGTSLMPDTSGGKVGTLIQVVPAGAAGYPGHIGIRL